MLKLFATGLFLAMVVFCHGQSWKENYVQAREFYAKDDYTQAITQAELALKNYQAESGGVTNENYSAILRLLSNITYAQGNFAAGLEYVRKELQIRAAQKDTLYAGALANQAQFFKQMGEYDHAIQALQESRQVLLKYFTGNDKPVLESSFDLGINYYLQNDFGKSNEWLQPAVTLCDHLKIYPDNSLEAFYYSGLLWLSFGKNEEAIRLLKKTQDLYEASGITNTRDYAMVLSGLAKANSEKQQYVEAEKLFIKAQSIYESEGQKPDGDYFKLLNERSVNLQLAGKNAEAEQVIAKVQATTTDPAMLAYILSNNASTHQSSGDYVKAEALYKEALAKYNQQDKASLLNYVETLENLAIMYSVKGDLENAWSTINEAKDIIGKSAEDNPKKHINVLNKRALIMTSRGMLEEAEKEYRQALHQSEATIPEPVIEKIAALNGLGALQQHKGLFTKADSIYQLILNRYRLPGAVKDNSYLVTLHNFAASKQAQGQLLAAHKLIAEVAIETAATHGRNDVQYADALEDIAVLNLKQGDLTDAKPELDSALAIYEQTAGRESVYYAEASINIGRYHQMMGDYSKAEPYLKRGRDIILSKKGKDNADYAAALNALALLYQTLGNYKDAFSLLKESKDIIERTNGKLNTEYSTSLQNIATLYQLDGKYGLAEPLLKESLDIDQKILGENHPQYAITLQNLATLYQKSGKQKEAEAILERALGITGRTLGELHPSYITTLSNLAASYQDSGNFGKAESTWKRCVDLRKRVLGEQHPDYTRSLYGLAGVYHAQMRLEEAKQYYEPVVKDYLKQIQEFFPSLSEKEKGAFYAKIKPVFDAYLDFNFDYLAAHPDQKKTTLKDVYTTQLATKAILFNSSSRVRSRILTSNNELLKTLYNEWISSKEDIVRYFNRTQDERNQLGVSLSSLEAKANDLEKQLSAQSDEFRNRSERDVSWESVKQVLQDKEVAVEILRIKKKYSKDSIYYAALVLSRSSEAPDFIIWPQGKQLEERRFKYHRNTIKFHYNDTLSYKFFWSPLEKKLSGNTTVYLSCDGVFNKVNFNSLYNKESKRWVIDDFAIKQLSSTRELASPRSIISSSANAIAYLFGDADFNLGLPDKLVASAKRSVANSYGFEGEEIPVLPATEKEVDGIYNVLQTSQWKVQSFKRNDATEENVKKVKDVRLIHIATHGFFLSDVEINENDEATNNPLFRSGVLLAGAGVDRSLSSREEDGVLTAYEAMNLNLDQTELVVLSACETGLGEVRNGEGVYGLQRSFMVAGAKNVLMSLWQVDDMATQELMNSFYSLWLGGMDKHKAFHEAQLKMKTKYSAPYFWGAFVLVGI